MGIEFASILRGLMDNRRLSARVVARASARAESTINQLLSGKIHPHADVLQDIAPVLQIPLADLFTIAGISTEPTLDRPAPYPATSEIGDLIAVASSLSPEQVERLIEIAHILKSSNP